MDAKEQPELTPEEKNQLLFGKFFNSVTHELTADEWKHIFNSLISEGVLTTRDWRHIRDIVWESLKRGAEERLDNASNINPEAGRSCILTELDSIIIEILGRENPGINGIIDDPHSVHTEDVLLSQAENVKESGDESRTPRSAKKARIKKKKELSGDTTYFTLKKKRLQLEIYNLQLDARKKEMDIGLPAGRLTISVEDPNFN